MQVALLSYEEIENIILSCMNKFVSNEKNDTQKTVHKEILAPSEVAKLLSTSTAALATMRYRKKGIPYSKHGKRVYYNYSDVLNYLHQFKVKLAS